MVTWMRPRLYPNLKRIPRVLTIIICSSDSTFETRLSCAADFTVRLCSVWVRQFLRFINTFCFPTDDESDSDAEEEQEKTVSCTHTRSRSCLDLNKHTLFWHITVPQLSLYSFVDVIDRFLPSVVFFSFTFCQKRRRATTGGQLDDKRREMLKRHPLSLWIELKCKGRSSTLLSLSTGLTHAVVKGIFPHSFIFSTQC